jgi:hypothetical protein
MKTKCYLSAFLIVIFVEVNELQAVIIFFVVK